MSERPQLDSDLMLGEAVTAARHTRTIALSGVDMPVRHHLLNIPPKKSQPADVLGKNKTSALVTGGLIHTL